jgi:hypothetical protein
VKKEGILLVDNMFNNYRLKLITFSLMFTSYTFFKFPILHVHGCSTIKLVYFLW